jgi:processive 1,2-diacylglycerol beta-glucosyltransferase
MMKKIIIFTSAGGGGHMSVTNALLEMLHDHYNVKAACIFTDVLRGIDPAQFFTFGKYTGEDFYNYIVRKKWFWLLNLIYKIGIVYYKLRKSQTDYYIEEYLKKEKPDLVISVIILVNGNILKISKQLNIPCMIVTTDLDCSTFIHGLQNPEYSKFNFNIIFDDPLIIKTLEPAHIPPECIKVTGLPLRAHFFEKKNKKHIKEFYKVPENKPVLLLIMGAAGSKSISTFVHALIQVPIPLHLLICLGRHEDMRKEIMAIALPNHISISIISFTERISDLMAIADLMITKSGSVSVCEGIYMNVPMILDATSTILQWEKLNHAFVKKHHFGEILYSIENIPSLLNSILVGQHNLEIMKNNLQQYHKKRADKEIPRSIEALLTQNP